MRRAVFVFACTLVGCGRGDLPSVVDAGVATSPATSVVIARADSAFRFADGAYHARGTAFSLSVSDAIRFSIAGETVTLRTELGYASPFIATDGDAVVRAHGVFAERVRNDGATWEHAWTLRRLPDGDVRIRVRVEGARLVGVTTSGGHYRASARTFVYGRATLIDANAVKSALETEYDADGITIHAKHSLLATAAFPVTIDPTVGPEFAIDAPIAGPANGRNVRPTVAYDGERYLVVWSSDRVRAVRVAKDGTVLDPFGLVLSGEVSPETAPAVTVAPQGGFVVAWASPSGDRRPRIGRVGVDGTIGAPDGSLVSAGEGSAPRVSACGTDVVVAWGEGANVLGARVPSVGPVSIPFTIATGSAPALAWGASTCVVAYEEPARHAVVARLVSGTTAGAPSDLRVGDATRTPRRPAIDFDGTGFFVAWDEPRAGASDRDLRAKRISTSLAETQAPFDVSTGAADDHSPRVAFSGGHLVTFVRSGLDATANDARAVRVSTAGVADPTALALASGGDARAVDVSAGASGHFVVHDLRLGDRADVIARTVSTSLGAAFAVSRAANRETDVKVASDGARFLVTWLDDRGDRPRVLGARIANDGTLLDTTPLAIGPAGIAQSAAAVAHDGTTFVAAWTETSTQVVARRIASDGMMSAPVVVTVGTIAGAPAIACRPEDCGVVWFAGTQPNVSGRGARLTGTTVSAPLTLTINPNELFAPALATDGTSYLFAYRRGAGLIGAVPWATGVGFESVLFDGPAVDDPDVAFGGGTYVVAFADGTGADSSAKVQRLDSMANPIGEALQVAKGRTPRLTWSGDGHHFLTMWRRNPLDPAAVDGVFIGPDLTRRDAADSILASGARTAAAAGSRSGRVLVAMERITAGSPQIEGTFVTAGALDGTSCTTSASCASKLCIDGVCCDGPCEGTCRSCSLAGSLGTCSFMAGLVDPPACASPFRCDEKGGCAKTEGETCALASDCASGHCVAGLCCASACNGACARCDATPGTCTARASGFAGTPSCTPFVCAGDLGCATTCATDAQCATGWFCGATGTCLKQLALGATCGAGDCKTSPCRSCLSGQCVDGACCESACTGPCEECASSPGRCTKAFKGDRGTPTCAPFTCGGVDGTCATICAVDADCALRAACVDGVCVAKLAQGQGCTAAIACSTGFCVDGVCCNVACEGQCEACDLASSMGKCTPVRGAPHASRPACAGDPTSCTTPRCDGVTPTKCSGLPGPEVECAAARCEGSRASRANRCDGNGKCVAPEPDDCAPYGCNDGACRVSCSVDGECVDTHRCVSGLCIKAPLCRDEHVIEHPGGRREDCAPYRCTPDGTCLTACRSTLDCITGDTCDARGVCSPAAPDLPVEEGCACRTTGRRSGAPFVPLALFIVAWLLRTRGSLLAPIAMLVLLGCSPGTPPLEDRAAASLAPRDIAVSAPITFGDSVQHPFRRSGDELSVTTPRYEARVGATGDVSLSSPEGAPIVLRTTPAATAPAELDSGDVTLRLEGGVVESLRALDEGVEQSWRVERRPASFSVRVAITGARLVAVEGGIDLVSAGMVHRYGRATWIDAAGIRTPVAARIDGTTIVLRVPDDLLARSAYPAVLDPIVGPAYPVSSITGETAAIGDQQGSVAGFTGSVYVVAWDDRRGGTSDTYAARITTDGTVLDAAGILVARDATPDSIACDPEGCVVVLSLSAGPSFQRAVRRVRSDGGVDDMQPVIASGLGLTAIVYAGDHYFVALGQKTTISVQRWSKALITEGSATVLTMPSGDTVGHLHGAFDGTRVAISYGIAPSNQVRLVQLDLQGAVVGTDSVLFTASLRALGTASDGQSIVVVAAEESAVTTRVRSAAGVLSAAASLPVSASRLHVAFDGTQYLVTYVERDARCWLRVSTAGTIVDTTPRCRPKSGESAIVGSGAGGLLTWTDRTWNLDGMPERDVFATRLAVDGTERDGDGFLVSRAGLRPSDPSVAFGTDSYVIAWARERPAVFAIAGSSEVLVARVSQDGVALGAPTLVSAPGVIARRPRIAALRVGYRLVWEERRADGSAVMAARITSTGVVEDPGGVAIAASTVAWSAPSIAPYKDEVFVAYVASASTIAAARLRADFTVGETSSTVRSAYPFAPEIACGTLSCAIAFRESSSPPAPSQGGAPYLAKVTRSFPLAIENPERLGDLGFDLKPDLSFSHGADPNAPVNARFVAVSSRPDGVLLAIAFDERLSAVTREAMKLETGTPSRAGVLERSASAPIWLLALEDASAPTRTLAIQWMATPSAALDRRAQPLASGLTTGSTFAFANDDTALVVYGAHDPVSHSARLFARKVASGLPFGSACTTNDECALRNCIDGVCCAEACGAACRTCSATPGSCTAITDADDLAGCGPDARCDALGNCRAKLGRFCSTSADCAEGTCVDAVCCSSACTAPCESCTVTPGTCTAAPARAPGRPTCAPYRCDGARTTCASTCTSSADCDDQSYCDKAGACVPKKAAGEACDPSADCQGSACSSCASGFCVGGLCCNSACSGACDECASVRGTCRRRTPGHPGAPTCAPAVCDGVSSTCPTTCADAFDCADGAFCVDGACRGRQADGVACTRDEQCANGHCADGVCCDSGCTGQCEACDVAENIGKCTPVRNSPHGARPACGGAPDDPCLASSCNGMIRTTCAGRAGPNVTCGRKRCDEGSELRSGVCDGAGSCNQSPRRSCAPYACGGDACRTSCATDLECAPQHRCQEGVCVAGSCDGDRTVTFPDGRVIDCAPFRCRANATCTSPCSSGLDCVAGAQCSARGDCVPVEAAPIEEESCACSTPGRSGAARGIAAVLLLGALLARRSWRDGALRT